MSGTTFLQLFLVIDVFIIGILATTSLRHAREHFKPEKTKPEAPQQPTEIKPTQVELPEEAKQRLLQASQAQFQTVLNHSSDQLLQDLKNTSGKINDLLTQLATEIVGTELEHYRTDLAELHKQAEADLKGVKKEMEGHETEIKAKIAAEYEQEKQMLIRQIDTKLADAVGSFLIETLQHNVDIGSQSEYLMAMLEEHKAEFIKEVKGEA